MKIDIPNNWKFESLEKQLEYVTGGDWGKDESYLDSNYELAFCIRGSEIKNWNKDKGNTASLRKVKKSSVKSRRLVEGDILVEISGGGPEQPVGRTVVIDKVCLNNRPDIPKICTNFLRLIRPKDNIDSLFLNYYLNLFYHSGEIVKLQAGSNNLRNLKFKDFIKIEIPIPPLHEQQAIVAKIEELFSDLENGKQQLLTAQQQLKVYRQSLLKWAFEGKLTNKNVKDGELPEGWKWVSVAEICDVVRGGSPRPAGDLRYYDGSIPFLKVKDLTKNNDTYLTTFEYTIKEAGLHKTRQIKPNTLLLSNSGATLGIPKICMIDATMNDGIAAFLNLDVRSNLYLYYFWLSKTKELRNINMGAAQPNLNTAIIKNYKVPYCSFEEQHRIVDLLESKLTVCDRIKETISQSLQQLEFLKQSILKKAFEGRLI